jgi:F0F1-type ATP synthase membrane subunit b/b'
VRIIKKEGGTMGTLVYKFGVLPPTLNQDEALRQMRLGHDHYNRLMSFLADRRDGIRKAMADAGMDEGLQDAREQAKLELQQAEAYVKERRAATRSRSETQSDLDRVSDARAKYKSTKEACSASAKLRRASSTSYKEEIRRLSALFTKRVKLARCELVRDEGLYWGTYLLVEKAADQAHDDARLYYKGEPSDPRRKRWEGDGRIGVQIQKGMTVEELFKADTRVRIAPVDERAWLSASRGERRKLSRTVLYLRVASDEKKRPIWVEFPMVMHRPIPAGSTIKEVVVHRTRVGFRYRWHVTFTVALPAQWRKEHCGTGAVAIDIGWRLMPDRGIRVAMVRGTDGQQEEIRLDEKMVSGLRLPSALQRTRDDKLNELLSRFLPWLKQQELPEWMSREIRSIDKWRSPARFASLAIRWRNNRWKGDKKGYTMLEGWRYRDNHLWDWESFQTRGSHGHREDFYRCAAKKLSQRYQDVVLEQFKLSDVARRGKTEDSPENKAARSNRQLVGVSRLRLAVVQAFLARGGRVVEFPAKNTTRTCNECGTVAIFDAAKYIDRNPPCPTCGAVWDQDHNACVNLLGTHSEWSNGALSPGTARVTPDPQRKTTKRFLRRKKKVLPANESAA